MMHEKREKANEYNAKGSPEMKEADDEKPEFAKGGKAKAKHRMKRKHGGEAMHEKHETKAEEHREEEKKKREHHKNGGHVTGSESKARPDKRPRRAAGGSSPYSSGSHTTKPMSSHASDGHENDRPPEMS